jgi:type I restriction enzyme S subunit
MFGDPVTNPKGWEVKKLGDVVDFVGGGTPSRARPDFFTGTICWATSKDMRGERLHDTQEHVTEEAIQQSSTKLVTAGTLLVVVKSKVLMNRLPICISEVPVCFGQDLKGLVPKEDGSREFLLRSIKLSEWTLLDRARGANTEGLTLDHLRELNVPWPREKQRLEYEQIAKSVRKLLVRLRTNCEATLSATLTQLAFSGNL